MKTYILIFFFVLFYSAPFAQEGSESYQDSLVLRTLQRALDSPQYPGDSSGVIVIQVQKERDSIWLEPIYNSMRQYSLPLFRHIQSRLSFKNLQTISDGYKRIITVYLHFYTQSGKCSYPSEEIKLLAEKKVEALKRNIKVLTPITIIWYEPIRCGSSSVRLIPMHMPGLLR
jgi:hypothetical protein